MTTRNSASKAESVETFLASLEHPYREEILAIRELILGVDPSIVEGIKWNAPSFHTTEYFATINLRAKKGVMVILYLGTKVRETAITGIKIADPDSLLEWLAKDRASVLFHDMDDITNRGPAFTELVRRWIAYV